MGAHIDQVALANGAGVAAAFALGLGFLLMTLVAFVNYLRNGGR
jgi:hypothetical protein